MNKNILADSNKVQAHFENLSKSFDGIYAGKQRSLLYRLVDILLRRRILKKRMAAILEHSGELEEKNILDIGCGSGWYSFALAGRQPNSVLGIDISSSMIELARQGARARGLENRCRFEKADFLEKDFQRRFDVVIAAGVLDYIPQAQQFLSKVGMVTKKRAVLSFPIKWTLMTLVRKAWLLKRKCPQYYYTKGQIKGLLELCGFKNISIYRIGSFLVPGNYIAVCEPGGN